MSALTVTNSQPHVEQKNNIIQFPEPAKLPMADSVEQWIGEVINGLHVSKNAKFGKLEKDLQERALQVLSKGRFGELDLTPPQRQLLTNFYDILKERNSGLEAFLAAFREKNKSKETEKRSWDVEIAYIYAIALLGLDLDKLEELFSVTPKAMAIYHQLKSTVDVRLRPAFAGHSPLSPATA